MEEQLERVRDPELEVEMELKMADADLEKQGLVDDLDDPWFVVGDKDLEDDDCYEIDPVHPLRRLSAWVRGRLAA
jgi:hypothetical protein